MPHWQMAWQGKDRCYRHRGDRRYHLRLVTEPSGQTQRTVWTLFLGDIRIWEVHALTGLRIVAADAEDYIRAARMAG